jgi:predicted alpha/beta hydrolase family esterase
MSQAVLVIHGAGEPVLRQGKVYWEPLLQADLGSEYEVHAPRMPNPDEPDYPAWADRIARLVSPMESPILVGHSFGASTVLKFLAQASPPTVRGAFLVATPFWGSNFPEFALTPEELGRLLGMSPLFFYHSEDDPEVGFSHFARYQRALPHASYRPLAGGAHEFNQPGFPELAADIRCVTGS